MALTKARPRTRVRPMATNIVRRSPPRMAETDHWAVNDDISSVR